MKSKRDIQNEIEVYAENFIEKNGNNDNFYEDENNSYIVISINKDNAYDEFSNKNRLNSEIFDYIDEYLSLTNKIKKLNVLFSFSDDFNSEEKEYIIELFKLHYAIKYKEDYKRLRQYSLMSLVLLMIGAALLTAYALLLHFNVNEVLSEIVSIFSWVFVWESCDSFVFSRSRTRLEILRSKKIFSANIVEKPAK